MSNADAHGKNISLIYRDNGHLELAPFYDLVSTRAYPTLDRKMAMAIGTQYDPDLVSASDFNDLAVQIGVRLPLLRHKFKAMAESLPIAINETKNEIESIGLMSSPP